MKILHVEGGRHLYGGARQVLLLLEGLAGQGIDNVLVCPQDSAIASCRPAAQLVPLSMRGDLDLRLIRLLRAQIDQVRPDLIHLHSRRGADWLGALAARGKKLPLVLSRRVDNPEHRLVAAIKYRLVDKVIAISQCIATQLRAQGVSANKIVCVPSAVPPAQNVPRDRVWFEQEFGIANSAPAIGVIAQLIGRKGHRYLLEAMPHIVSQCPDARLLILGQGPHAPQLHHQVSKLGLDGAVVFAGFRNDLDKILPNLDLVAHPALAEGLGIALLQSAQAGLALVASDAGGIPELIRPGRSGILVPPRDAAALADAVIWLIKNPGLSQKMGAAGAQWVADKFSVSAMVSGNLAVYRQLVSRG